MSGCIVGLMKVRNEDWILGLSARAALRVCDKLVVLDHGSTDRTFEILAEVGAEHRNRVKVMPWHDPVFAEMAMYEHMLGLGREWGGTHFYLVDADEVLAAHMADVVRNTVLSLIPREYLEVPFLSMTGVDVAITDPGTVWRDNLLPLAWGDEPRIAFRPLEDGYDWHRRLPSGCIYPRRPWITMNQGGVLHYAWADWRRITIKAVWYKMTEVVRWPGRAPVAELNKRYDRPLQRRVEQSKIPGEWVDYAGWRKHVRIGGDPWQLRDIADMIARYGWDRFEGITWHGVDRMVMGVVNDLHRANTSKVKA